MNPSTLLLVLCAVLASPVQAQGHGKPTLWSSDDVNKRIYHLTLNGRVLFDFHSGSISGLSVDSRNDSIWAAKEGSGLVVHFDRLGNELGTFPAPAFGIGPSRPEGVAVDERHNSLWLVDDQTLVVYNLSMRGVLLSSFSSTSVDPAAISPQAIEIDPADDTLWFTDNQADRVYNVTRGGQLISSFPTSSFGTGVENVQGIGVDDSNGTLWITDRTTNGVYNVTRDGTLIAQFFAAAYDSFDPTGIAWDAANAFGLNAATAFGTLGGSKVRIHGPDAGVIGDVGLAAGATQVFGLGFVEGTLHVDPKADNTREHGVAISGGTVLDDLSAPARDLEQARQDLGAFPPTQSFKAIKSTTTIAGEPGLNVIDVGRIFLGKQHTLTLQGGPDARFLVNTGRLKLKGAAAIVLDGGVDARDVLFHVGGGKQVSLLGSSTLAGTVLTGGKVGIHGTAAVHGAVLSLGDIVLRDSGQIRHAR